MILPFPPERYDRRVESERNLALEMADRDNYKRGQDIVVYPARIVLTSPDGSQWPVQVDDDGVISTGPKIG